jgi:hypothetical protein
MISVEKFLSSHFMLDFNEIYSIKKNPDIDIFSNAGNFMKIK